MDEQIALITNEKNVKDLQGQTYYLGMGRKLDQPIIDGIKKATAEGKTEFTIDDVEPFLLRRPGDNRDNPDKMDKLIVEPNFSRSDKHSDTWFLNNYRAETTYLDMKTNQEVTREQYVSTQKGKSYTVTEIGNALRAGGVFKTWKNAKGRDYKGWKWLDLDIKKENGNFLEKVSHEKYGFQLDEALDKLPIKFYNDEDRQNVIRSIQRGNAHDVLMREDDGRLSVFFVAANLEKEQMDIYNKDGSYNKELTENYFPQQKGNELASDEKVSDMIDRKLKEEGAEENKTAENKKNLESPTKQEQEPKTTKAPKTNTRNKNKGKPTYKKKPVELRPDQEARQGKRR